MRALALPAIRFYQRHISPYKGFRCAYCAHTGRASCSTLGLRVIRRFGVWDGLPLLRQRLSRCGIAYRRYGPARAMQLGSAPCDIPCDPGCDLPGCKHATRFLDCCDVCSCDWPDKKRKRKTDEKYVHIPPNSRPEKRGPRTRVP